ncbi:hypothetical protein V7O61_07820 [Methanolobus sp. WCC1]|uniref:hypothetical protein n=1 Tax=unclassified Methanolobus TaxID=2629569 RepID=UPI00324D0A1D
MVKPANLDARHKNTEDINSFLERRDRLVQTLIILMGLTIASPIVVPKNMPSIYFLIFFVYILCTILLYSDIIASSKSNGLLISIEFTLAMSFSYSFVFAFVLNGYYTSNPIVASITLIALMVAIVSSIHVESEQYPNYYKKRLIDILFGLIGPFAIVGILLIVALQLAN